MYTYVTDNWNSCKYVFVSVGIRIGLGFSHLDDGWVFSLELLHGLSPE